MKIRLRFFVCLVLVFALFFCSVISVSASSYIDVREVKMGYDRVITTYLQSIGETFEGFDSLYDKVHAAKVPTIGIYCYSDNLKDVYIESSQFNIYLKKYNDCYGTNYTFDGRVYHRVDKTNATPFYLIPDVIGDIIWKNDNHRILAPGAVPVVWKSVSKATISSVFNEILNLLPVLVVAIIGFIAFRKAFTWFGGIIKGM